MIIDGVNLEKLKRRLAAKYRKAENGCWEWFACEYGPGYGGISVNYRKEYAHRVMYEIHKGEIPEGLELDHLCRNRGCVNPDHLEAVTHSENILRSVPHRSYEFLRERNRTLRTSVRLDKPYCLRGHEMTPENSYSAPGSNNKTCKECTRIRLRERMRKLRASGWKEPTRKERALRKATKN